MNLVHKCLRDICGAAVVLALFASGACGDDDASPADSGGSDTGVSDTGTGDTSIGDTGVTDTGPADSGDGAVCRSVPEATDDGCPSGWFHYFQDYCCSTPPPDNPSTCPDSGDGMCHFECTTDADCDPCRPHCRTVGLCDGGDSNCNGTFRACMADDGVDDCI